MVYSLSQLKPVALILCVFGFTNAAFAQNSQNSQSGMLGGTKIDVCGQQSAQNTIPCKLKK